jgi:hypothetical protein
VPKIMEGSIDLIDKDRNSDVNRTKENLREVSGRRRKIRKSFLLQSVSLKTLKLEFEANHYHLPK